MKKTFIVLTVLTGLILQANAQSLVKAYADKFSQKAQELMVVHRVPASVILGIAYHESAGGKSKVARYLNNHFGFKGKNSNRQIKSAYKDFPDIDSSYNYFITFLKSRSKYNGLFDENNLYNYKAWIKGIQKGGYAASKTWAAQVLQIINKYELYAYDLENPYLHPTLLEPLHYQMAIFKPKQQKDNFAATFLALATRKNLDKLAVAQYEL